MSNNLGLTVKPITPISPEEEARVASVDRHRRVPREELRAAGAGREPRPRVPAARARSSRAHGFEGTLPFVHGSQGCASYYRSTLNRHFREPAPAVSDAMTEDGAVFGGQNNLHEGLENAIALYKPKMIAVFTSCMPEIIGDDLTAFLKNARAKGIVPKDLPVPFANTPSFNGSHIHGYDAMLARDPPDAHGGEADRGALHREAEPHRRLRREHRQLPRVPADPRGLRDPGHVPRRPLRDVRLPQRRHLPALPRRHAARRGGRRDQRQGHAHGRALRHDEDLRLGEGDLRRQARLAPDADGDCEDRRVPPEALRAVRQAGAGRRSRRSAAAPSTR